MEGYRRIEPLDRGVKGNQPGQAPEVLADFLADMAKLPEKRMGRPPSNKRAKQAAQVQGLAA